MSDTPRTDKLATTLEDYAGYNEVVPADECRAIERELAELRKDKERLDWLADRDNCTGQVLLPTGCVQNNLSSLRDAIDEAMAENPTKENSMSKEQEQRIINILVNEALRADKERLEWLLENAVIQYYPTTHPDDLCRITSKDDVDEAMKGE